ncbi:hypothetical protein ACOSQ3_031848 [Xanthoceras sorbifolium]
MKMIQQQRGARARPRPVPPLGAARGVEEEASSEQREEPSATCARMGNSRCRNHMQSMLRGELKCDLPSSRSSLSKQSSEGRGQATATTGRVQQLGRRERARGSAVQAAFKLFQG